MKSCRLLTCTRDAFKCESPPLEKECRNWSVHGKATVAGCAPTAAARCRRCGAQRLPVRRCHSAVVPPNRLAACRGAWQMPVCAHGTSSPRETSREVLCKNCYASGRKRSERAEVRFSCQTSFSVSLDFPVRTAAGGSQLQSDISKQAKRRRQGLHRLFKSCVECENPFPRDGEGGGFLGVRVSQKSPPGDIPVPISGDHRSRVS